MSKFIEKEILLQEIDSQISSENRRFKGTSNDVVAGISRQNCEGFIEGMEWVKRIIEEITK